MRALFLVFALVTVTLAGIAMLPGRICPLANRDDLLACLNLMDGDADTNITPEEIDAFTLAHASCIPADVRAILTGANIVTLCDTDADGNLTSTDWTAPTGCLHLRSRQMALCRACDKCGLFVVKK